MPNAAEPEHIRKLLQSQIFEMAYQKLSAEPEKANAKKSQNISKISLA